MSKTSRLAGVAAAIALGVGATAVGASAERGSYNNWHVHDGGSGTDPNGLVHRGVVFFPSIFGASYLEDPAYCPDATDKLSLPNGSNGEFPLAGVCQTSAYVIQLRAIPDGDPVPPGWSGTGWFADGAEIYYMLTPR